MPRRFVKFLMQVDPKDRPNAEQAARHQFLVHGDTSLDEMLSKSSTVVAPGSVHRSSINSPGSSFKSLSQSSGTSSHALMQLPKLGATDFVGQFGAGSPPNSPVARVHKMQSSFKNRPLHLQEGNLSPDSRTPSLKGTPCVSPVFSFSNLRPTRIPKMESSQRSTDAVNDLHLDATCAETYESDLADGKISPTGLGLGSYDRASRPPKICSPMPGSAIDAKPGATRQFSVQKSGACEKLESQVQPEFRLWKEDALHNGIFVRKIDIGEPDSRPVEDLPG